MMKLADVQKLQDLDPRHRAVQILEMGAQLQKRRRRAPKPGTLPTPLRRESIMEAPMAPLLERLHGIRGAEPRRVTGLHKTGRRLLTRVGEIQDLVLTPQGRKKYIREAMNTENDKSLNDLAIRQLAVSMLDNAPITRCCAAYAYWQATGAEAAIPILTNALASQDVEEQIVGAYCLGKVRPQYVEGLEGTAEDDQPHSPVQPVKDSMTVIVHGTFAKDAAWYQPGGDFHQYIKDQVFADVYSSSDFFFWSGRYAQVDQELKRIWMAAAEKLVSWCLSHPAQKLRLIGHSHGNNVINMATQLNLPTCTLIQLSPPVRSWNLPEKQNVSSGRFFNVHCTVDLVVLVDGGARNYRNTAVAAAESRKKIAWFGHAKSHDANAWSKKRSPAWSRVCVPKMVNEQDSSSGSGLGAIGVLLNYGIAQIAPGTGVRRLVEALGSPDEDTSVAAYTVLVKLGPRIARRLVEEAKKGRQTASVVQVLGDLGEPSVIPDLEEFARSADPEVASAARQSLDVLRQAKSHTAIKPVR